MEVASAYSVVLVVVLVSVVLVTVEWCVTKVDDVVLVVVALGSVEDDVVEMVVDEELVVLVGGTVRLVVLVAVVLVMVECIVTNVELEPLVFVVLLVFELLVVLVTLVLVEGAGTVSVVVAVDVLVVGGNVVEEFKSSGQTPGGGASLRFRSVPSFFDSSPPNTAQYRFESVPMVSTMPTRPWNGVGRVTPVPLHAAFTTFAFTRTTWHGSPGVPAPLYL
jgi:hypothetical protein